MKFCNKTNLYRSIVTLTFILILIIGNVFYTISQNLYSTPRYNTEEILKRFDRNFKVMDSVIFRASSPVYYSDVLETIFLNYKDRERIEEIDRLVDSQIGLMKSNTGLEFAGQVYARPGSKVSYDPDDPLVAYNAKFQGELQWNIFKSSIYKRKLKTKELQIQGDIEQLDYAHYDREEELLYLKQFIKFRHYGRLLSVLNLHSENIDLLMETQLHLLEKGKISGDDILKLINEKSEIDRQLISIKVDSVVTAIPAPFTVAYINHTDTAGILRSISENNIEIKKIGLKQDLLDVQRKNTDYVQTMNIQPFVRYSYYNRKDVDNTYNLDLGVSFRLPLSGEVSKKRKVLDAQKEVLEYQQKVLETETSNGIFLAFHELEIYNENILGEYQRMKNLKDYLSMRHTSYDNVDGEYSRLLRLQEYNSFLQAWERLLDYTYRRDCVLLDLQRYLLNEPISNYIDFKVLI